MLIGWGWMGIWWWFGSFFLEVYYILLLVLAFSYSLDSLLRLFFLLISFREVRGG